MNVKILFTFQVIFIYKSYWLLIFKSEKDKSYSLIGVQGMLVVPNCWDVGTWGWLERKIESLFLWMDTLIYGPRGYYGHFALQMDNFIYAFGILPSPEWILEEERRHWNLKVENIAINMWRRIINSSRNYNVYFLVMYKIMKCYPTLT